MAAGASAAPAPAAASAAPGAAAQAVLQFDFRGSAWVQVRDRDGQVVLTQTGAAGSRQTVSATPPLEVVLGHASAVGVTYRGKPVDITPFVRGDVARFQLK
jgi:cytoskeleton protein RodZ